MSTPRITETALANMILKIALEFVGLKEIKPNARFDDPKTPGVDVEKCERLRAMMRPAPWKEGWAHCAAFVEGVVCEALRRCGATEEMVQRFARIHGAHVMTNVREVIRLGLLSPAPSIGALWLAQFGSTSKGHEGIVQVPVVNPGRMTTVESNTSAGPAQTANGDREGDWITSKSRSHRTNGKLKTRGFLSIASIIKIIYS